MNQAAFNYDRAEGYSSKGKQSTAMKFYDKCDSVCEKALRMLQEMSHYNNGLSIGYDNDINFEVGGDLSEDIGFHA